MSTDYPVANSDDADVDSLNATTDSGELEQKAADAVGDEPFDDEDGVLYDEEVKPEFGILGFTLRELLIVGVWLIAFVTSFFPLVGGASIWAQGIQWLLPIGIPTAATFLVVLRRFSPDGIRRVGSLGIDQFASVAYSVAAIFWVQTVWTWVASGLPLTNWVAWVQLVATLALVGLTVFAPLIPALREDFHGRLVTLAHRNANPVRPVIARPRAERPIPAPAPVTDDQAAAPVFDEPSDATSVLDLELSGQSTTDEIQRLGLAEQVPLTAHASGGDIGAEPVVDDSDYVPGYARRSRGDADAEANTEVGADVDAEPTAVATDLVVEDHVVEDLDATKPREQAPASQPFWALAPSERDVLDDRGTPLFRIGPDAWALVIEDRGGAYVVRHDDGRIGYLHDIADITKG